MPNMRRRYWIQSRMLRLLVSAAACLIFVSVPEASFAQTTDTIPPTPPTGLVATASSCGQVDLAWGASTDNVGGSGMKAYLIFRNDGVNTTIGAARTAFSDTSWVRSATTLTYYVVAQDNAGNISAQSNTVTVVTPTCPMSLGE